MGTERRTQVEDVAALRALASPARYRLIGLLMAEGPATATALATRIGITPSNASYHLRELARYGLVEPVDGGTDDGRQRLWRTSSTGFSYGPERTGAPPDPAAIEASRRLLHIRADEEAALLHAAVATHEELPEAWREASVVSTYELRLSPAELTALGAAIDAIVRPYIGLVREDSPEDAASVHVGLVAFPRPGAG